MSNNPLIHREYIEVVTSEDLAGSSSDRANKVVATNESGIIPLQLLPEGLGGTTITVDAVTVAGDVTLLAGSNISLEADDNTNIITVSAITVPSVNGVSGSVSIQATNNLFLRTDLNTGIITVSDDLIEPPLPGSLELASVSQSGIYVSGMVSQLTTYHIAANGTSSLIKTVNFSYDAKRRLETETVTFPGSTKTITKTYFYPEPESSDPEEIPTHFIKTISD